MTPKVDLGEISEELKQLSSIEARLNRKLTSRQYREELFSDPVKVLKEEGITLPQDYEHSVTELFKSAMVPEDAELRLSADTDSAMGIFISIGIRF